MSTPAERLNLSDLEQAQIRALRERQLEVGNQLNIDADRAMRSLAVGQYTGLGVDLIDANLEELEEQLRTKKDFDPDAWKRESPGFAEFAAENPYHLAVLKHDGENLTKWERNKRAISLSVDSTWAKVEYNKLQTRRAHGDKRDGDQEKLAEYEKLMQPHQFGAESLWARTIVYNAKEFGPSWFSTKNAVDEMLLGMAAGGIIGGKLALPAAPATMGVSELIGVGGGMATGGFVGWRVGLAEGGYTMITGEAYGRYLKAGFSEENAAIAAKAAGAFGAAVEPFGINQLLKFMPGAKGITHRATQGIVERLTGQILQKQTVKAATGRLIARYGEVMGSEIMVEIIQDSGMTVGQNILADIEDKPDAYVTKDMWLSQMGETVVETAKAVTLMAAAGPGLSYIGDFARARRANGLRIAYEALGEAAADSKLRQSVPAKFREYVERASGGVRNVLMNVERFDTYFQDIGQDPDKIATELGIEAEALAHARSHDGFLEVPVGTFAEKIAASEHYSQLAMDVKTDMEQMTTRESNDFLANATELEKAYALGEPPAGHVPVQEILDRMRNELMADGKHDFSAASKLAALEEHRFSTIASNEGIDPLDLFNEKFGGIQREMDTTGEAVDVDLKVDPLLDLLRAEKGPKQKEIYGESLVEFLTKAGGLTDEGGELAAADLGIEFPALMKNGKLSLDAAAELAYEAGYIADYDMALLQQALVEREARGEAVFGRGVDQAAMTLSRDLDEMAEYLARNDIDVQAMTNVEIRKALRGEERFEQDEIIEVPGALPQGILEEQDFGDLQIVMDVEIAGRPDEIVGISRSANTAYQRAVNRLRSMQDLLECLNAA